MDFVRSPDDAKVEEILQRAAREAFAKRPDEHIGDCPACGVTETLMLGALCHLCDTLKRDSDSQRAFCDLIHRKGKE